MAERAEEKLITGFLLEETSSTGNSQEKTPDVSVGTDISKLSGSKMDSASVSDPQPQAHSNANKLTSEPPNDSAAKNARTATDKCGSDVASSTPIDFHFEGFNHQGELIVSEADKKEYRRLLLSNGLRVLLIHEPEGLKTTAVAGVGGPHSQRPRAPSSGGNSGLDDSADSADGDDEEEASGDESGSGSDDDSADDEFDAGKGSVGAPSSSRRSGGGGGGGSSALARRSAAALCVGSGSADEGAEMPGLAHFLEHMVFMGSAKYPDENDFDAYVSERGGESNAWTDMEQTLFHFDCRQESFADCLDRFANFFVEPLLSADSLEREVEAVHSEFEEACCSLQSQMEYFVGCLATPGHPLAGFKWGNRKSLWQLPRDLGLDARARLQAFRLAHYRAGNMTAVLQSRLSLDALEATARAAFGSLPAGSRSSPPELPLSHQQSTHPAFSEQFRGRAYCLLPVKQVDRLRLSWPCPPVRHPINQLVQPQRIIGFCLAHEGAGSLADCLRREGLAVELVAGVDSGSGMSDNTAASLMELSVKLTPKGLLDWRRVVRLTHAYIGMLGARLPDLRRVYDEMRGVERAAFRFAEEVEPAESVELASLNMHRLPAPLWLLGDRLPHRFDLDCLRRYWECLRPSNACVLIASRSFEAACDRVTDWFEIRYSELAPDPASMADWERCVDSPDPQLLAQCQLHLPPPNPFIAAAFDVPTPEEAYKEVGLTSVPQFPIRLTLDDPSADRFGLLYYFKDRKFKLPRAMVRVSLESPVICETPKSSAVAHVWLYMLNFQLHRDAYAANEASLSYEIVLQEPFSVVIDLEGFNDKLFVLYSTILDKWAQLGDMLAAKDPALKFDSAKEETRKVLANQLFSAKRFAGNARNYLLERDRHLASDQLACLEALTADDVADFHRRLLLRAAFKVYVHGNYRPEDAKQYFRRTLALLPKDAEVAEVRNTCAALPAGRHGARLQNLRAGDVNSLLLEELQWPHPPCLRDLVLADVLLHIMWEPCFDFLRTKHQLGYHVTCQTNRRRGGLSCHILVQSQADKCSMDRLQQMVDQFLVHFDKQLRTLPAGQFANYVQAVLDQKLAEDSAMADEAERYWTELADGGLAFDRRVREAELLRRLTQPELLPFYRQLVAGDRRSFSFQVEGSTRKLLHSGGTAGFSLPLSYAQTPRRPSASSQRSSRGAPSKSGGGSSGGFTRPIAYTGELQGFKAGLEFHRARPVVE